VTAASSPLAVSFASLEFQNPLLLASGTAAFGREIAGVIDLDSLGGIVTKAVSPSPGAAPLRRVSLTSMAG
jgi:dihydroorotate dehydrogenase (NAD+) catalytic subunit